MQLIILKDEGLEDDKGDIYVGRFCTMHINRWLYDGYYYYPLAYSCDLIFLSWKQHDPFVQV
jgi:hypothetical protein